MVRLFYSTNEIIDKKLNRNDIIIVCHFVIKCLITFYIYLYLNHSNNKT